MSDEPKSGWRVDLNLTDLGMCALVCVLIILLYGEPDLLDAIISWINRQ